MDIHSLKFGDIVHSSDYTLIKVHHIGKNGEVYYMAYADAARGRLQREPYTRFYGFISSCYQATEDEKNGLKIGLRRRGRKTVMLNKLKVKNKQGYLYLRRNYKWC